MSQQGVLNHTGGGGGAILTLSSEGGPPTPPSLNNFNFSGSVAGGSAANGAIEFITPGGPGHATDGQMDANVLVDNTTIGINGSNQLHVIGSIILHWNVVSTNQVGASNNGYVFVSPGGALTISLPAVSAVGDEFIVTLDGATSFQVTQAAGQQVRLGNLATTAGVGGSLTSTQQGDTLTMVCSVANLKWNVLSSMGNPIVV